MGATDFTEPNLYINRELSLLEFNRRVLHQAKLDSVPLLERMRFLCIASSNLDEFFEIRVAGLKQQEAYGLGERGPDKLTPHEQLVQIGKLGHEFVDEQYRVLNEMLMPILNLQGIRILQEEQWNLDHQGWLKQYFATELAPILNPVALDPTHPFPRVLNKGLSFIITLEGEDAFGRELDMAVVQAPRSLPRVIRLPDERGQGVYNFVLLTSIIAAHVGELFQGVEVTGCYQFRVTRNSDLFVDEEEVDDLLSAVEGELSSRRFGDAVRLEIAGDCPNHLEEFLSGQFSVLSRDVYRCNGPVNLMRLNQIPDLVERRDLKFLPFKPVIPKRLGIDEDIFSAIRSGDILLHHPFHSFSPVVEFLRQSANDPDVVSIRQTLYRTGPDSTIARALTDAANNGKEVLVVIELRARFDEEANIELANTLQEAGAQVVYGVVGYKTHAKMILVTRREHGHLKHYIHMGTGNYHPSTARLYTDYGLLTCDPEMTEDVQRLFQQLISMGRAGQLNKIVQSPFNMHSRIVECIDQEIAHTSRGGKGRIIAKMNQLIDPEIIRKLYAASCSGVKIELIIRGLCALRPGVKGVSENIIVRSIIGRFLEHTRVFYFQNNGSAITYLSSADWMGRNFFRRVEATFPIDDERIANGVLDDLELYLSDDSQSWTLNSDGTYTEVSDSEGEYTAQSELLRRIRM